MDNKGRLQELLIRVFEILWECILSVGPEKKARDFRPVPCNSGCEQGQAEDCRVYIAGLAFVGAVPSVVKRMTPDWSVKKPRWPLWPTALGKPVAV